MGSGISTRRNKPPNNETAQASSLRQTMETNPTGCSCSSCRNEKIDDTAKILRWMRHPARQGWTVQKIIADLLQMHVDLFLSLYAGCCYSTFRMVPLGVGLVLMAVWLLPIVCRAAPCRRNDVFCCCWAAFNRFRAAYYYRR